MAGSFSARLSTALEALGVSNTELEERAPFSKGAVGRLRSTRGKRPSASTVVKISQALGVRVEWLLSGEGEMLLDKSTQIQDPHPNRVEVYASNTYKNAPPQVQEWFRSRRLNADLSAADWERALQAATVLSPLGLLYGPRPRSKSAQ